METTLITHSGLFHADEVFAVALLQKYLLQNFNIVRTRDQNIINEGLENPQVFVIDVGLKSEPENLNFDHHQNSLPIASNMLVFDWLIESEKISNLLAKELRLFMQGISIFDTGYNDIIKKWDDFNPYHQFRNLSGIISGFNRNPNDANIQDSQFNEAVKFASIILENEIFSAWERVKAHQIWEDRKILKNGRVLQFSEFCQLWKENSKGSDVEFAIMPASPTQWNIISIESGQFPLPEEQVLKSWLSDESNFVFAHKGRFIAGFKTLESCLEIVEKL
jgi:uncharacterized UPF0160 family protein